MHKVLRAVVAAAAAWALFGSVGAAFGATGTPVASLKLPLGGGGESVAFDGHVLYYTNPGELLIHRMTTTGVELSPIVTNASLRVISYDATRDMFWGIDEFPGRTVYLVDKAGTALPQPQIDLGLMDATGACDNGDPVLGGVPGLCDVVIGGIAYDSNPDSIWVSPDGTNRIYHFGTDGAFLGFFDVNEPGSAMVPDCEVNYASGVVVPSHTTTANGTGNAHMYVMAGPCRTWFKYLATDDNKPQKLAAYPTYDGLGNAEDNECDDVTFSTNVMWVRDSADSMVHAFDAPNCILGGGTKILDKSRMTGGGGLPVAYPLASGQAHNGFMIHCDQTVQPNRLEVNWGNGNRFHLTQLDTVSCPPPAPLVGTQNGASFDTIKGTGHGRLNGTFCGVVDFSFKDNGEPGTTDTGDITVKDCNGVVVMHATGMLLGGPLLGEGNYQTHQGH